MLPEGDVVEFRLLGPLEAVDETGPLKLAGGKQNALLALLLLRADRVVPVDRLVDDLWGEDVPETAHKMVQIHVSHLRKQLPDGLLRTRAPGYEIALDDHTLDLREFERLSALGRDALRHGRVEEATTTLREALARWRGPALAEFQEPFAVVERPRLAEQQLTCWEDRIEADLAAGQHHELVAELEALARRHPLRERLRGQLMLALYRAGRHAEALESYQAFRRLLDEQLGINPPARLKALERMILQQDVSLDHDSRERTTGGDVDDRTLALATLARPWPEAAGRERELTRLERLYGEARTGARRLTFITGEAGIGKTTIVESFLARVGSDAETVVAHGQCVEHRGAGEPYLPVLDALGALARRPRGRQLVPLLARQAPTWVAQMPWLVSDDELEAIHRRLIGATHERMLREMLETLEAVSRESALVLVLEDLHWSDPSTVDLLDALARRREAARLLVVGTYRRSEAVTQDHPIHRLARDLRGRGLCTEIAVGPLSQEALAGYVETRLGSDAPSSLSALLHARTGGNPLFVTSLLDSWLERGLLRGEHLDVDGLTRDVPDTVRELIEQMLEQLEPSDRELLAAASAIGQEFSIEGAAAASERRESVVDARCDALGRIGRFLDPADDEPWPNGIPATRYRFVHDLHREVLYESLPATRRAAIHARIGNWLQTVHGDLPKEIAAELSDHFVRAGDAERAIPSLRLAAEQAVERLAHREALEHVTTALAMIDRLPEGPDRWSEELALGSMLGAAQIATRGWSATEAEAAFLRARELAERLDSADDLVRTLFRLGTLYEVRGEYERSEALINRTLEVSGSNADSRLLTDSHELLACSLFHQGVFDRALEHAEQGLATYDRRDVNPVKAAYGDNAGSACHTWAALSLWFLGFPDLARRRAGDAVSLAEDPRRRHGYGTALAHAAIVEQCCLDTAATRATAEAAIVAATEGGYVYRVAMATILNGWAIAAEGSYEDGITELERGLELSHETGARMDDAYYLALLADACLRAGRIDQGLAAVEAGLADLASARRYFFESELHRLAGELLIRLERCDEAEASLDKALEVARAQRSPSLELRVALSLAKNVSADGKRDEAAHELVASVYSRFSEGFDTHDLVGARELLEQLAPREQARTAKGQQTT
jgi:DNA-binding SARP family transcriptional activator